MQADLSRLNERLWVQNNVGSLCCDEVTREDKFGSSHSCGGMKYDQAVLCIADSMWELGGTCKFLLSLKTLFHSNLTSLCIWQLNAIYWSLTWQK